MVALRGPELPNWAAELNSLLPQDDGGRGIFDLVHEFLHTAGQSSLVLQVLYSVFMK